MPKIRLPFLGRGSINISSPYVYTVAASDSSAKSKASADFILTGIADQIKIQELVDDVSLNGGGKIFLHAGTYRFTDSVVGKSGVTIEGVYPKVINTTSPSTCPDLGFTINSGTIITGMDASGSGTAIIAFNIPGTNTGADQCYGFNLSNLGFVDVKEILRQGSLMEFGGGFSRIDNIYGHLTVAFCNYLRDNSLYSTGFVLENCQHVQINSINLYRFWRDTHVISSTSSDTNLPAQYRNTGEPGCIQLNDHYCYTLPYTAAYPGANGTILCEATNPFYTGLYHKGHSLAWIEIIRPQINNYDADGSAPAPESAATYFLGHSDSILGGDAQETDVVNCSVIRAACEGGVANLHKAKYATCSRIDMAYFASPGGTVGISSAIRIDNAPNSLLTVQDTSANIYIGTGCNPTFLNGICSAVNSGTVLPLGMYYTAVAPQVGTALVGYVGAVKTRYMYDLNSNPDAWTPNNQSFLSQVTSIGTAGGAISTAWAGLVTLTAAATSSVYILPDATTCKGLTYTFKKNSGGIAVFASGIYAMDGTGPWALGGPGSTTVAKITDNIDHTLKFTYGAGNHYIQHPTNGLWYNLTEDSTWTPGSPGYTRIVTAATSTPGGIASPDWTSAGNIYPQSYWQNIDGALTNSYLSSNYSTITLVSDGDNWQIAGKSTP